MISLSLSVFGNPPSPPWSLRQASSRRRLPQHGSSRWIIRVLTQGEIQVEVEGQILRISGVKFLSLFLLRRMPKGWRGEQFYSRQALTTLTFPLYWRITTRQLAWHFTQLRVRAGPIDMIRYNGRIITIFYYKYEPMDHHTYVNRDFLTTYSCFLSLSLPLSFSLSSHLLPLFGILSRGSSETSYAAQDDHGDLLQGSEETHSIGRVRMKKLSVRWLHLRRLWRYSLHLFWVKSAIALPGIRSLVDCILSAVYALLIVARPRRGYWGRNQE